MKNGAPKRDDLWQTKGQKKGFRCYLAGLLGESKRKNIAQITDNIIGSSFLKELEKLKLKYIGGLAKNRQATVINRNTREKQKEKRLDEIILSLSKEDFQAVTLELEQPKTVWVATIQAETNGLEGHRNIALVMNANSVEKATEIDYLITNSQGEQVTGEWIVKTFSNRNYLEKFYREACMLVRLKRVPDEEKRKFNSSLHFGIYCLYLYYLSAINGRT